MTTKPPEDRKRKLELRARKHAELQADLKNPILIEVQRGNPGDRRVFVIPPWNYNSKAEFREDGALSDHNGVDTPGGVGGYATGYEDYYCLAFSQEMRVFALELLALSAIAENWEEFFDSPGTFLKENWPTWAKAAQMPALAYKLVWV